MKTSEAQALVAMLQAYYPGAAKALPDSTVSLWADALTKYELGDGSEAMHLIASHGSYLPALAEIEAAIRSCRDARMLRESPKALPSEEFCSFEEFLRGDPEARERVRKLGIWRDVLERSEAPACRG